MAPQLDLAIRGGTLIDGTPQKFASGANGEVRHMLSR